MIGENKIKKVSSIQFNEQFRGINDETDTFIKFAQFGNLHAGSLNFRSQKTLKLGQGNLQREIISQLCNPFVIFFRLNLLSRLAVRF